MSVVSSQPMRRFPNPLTMSRPQAMRAFRTTALVLALISFIKYASIAVQSFKDAPHFFLAFLVLPYAIAGLLVMRARRTAAVLYLLFGLLYAWLMILQLFTGIEDNYWGDYMLVYAGLPVCVVGLVLALRVLFSGGSPPPSGHDHLPG